MEQEKIYKLPNSCNSCNRKFECIENEDLCAMRCMIRKGHKNIVLSPTLDEITGEQFPSAYQSKNIIS